MARLPKDPCTWQKWVLALQRDTYTPGKRACLCSKHFAPEDFDRTSLFCIRPRENAVPSCPGMRDVKTLGLLASGDIWQLSTHHDSLVELQQIEAELSDSDQALSANQEEEEQEMVDDSTPSTSSPHNREVLSVCEFWMKYNIKNAVDKIVKAWHKINLATVLHARKPLFANFEVSGAEQTEASGEKQCGGNTNGHSRGTALEAYDTRPHPRNHICPVLDKVIVEEYKTLYMSRVNARQQALITRHLHKAQPIINALANITLGSDDGTTDDDIEVLGDLLVEELCQDFEGLILRAPVYTEGDDMEKTLITIIYTKGDDMEKTLITIIYTEGDDMEKTLITIIYTERDDTEKTLITIIYTEGDDTEKTLITIIYTEGDDTEKTLITIIYTEGDDTEKTLITIIYTEGDDMEKTLITIIYTEGDDMEKTLITIIYTRR
ncbi:putative THAP-like domain-containing protein 3 [Homarus americanus]|uniref:Putative THAP-like domain-containing protein 3 n=1 Tax=Homarus americanus TaxID=6706 RepID=A0A8J5NCC3_HOMAM|nr:putative THAP-like domain-containing protein 3 [Homarus americanus]